MATVYHVERSASPRKTRMHLSNTKSLNLSALKLEKSMSLDKSVSVTRSLMVKNGSLPSLKHKRGCRQEEVTEFSLANHQKLLQKSILVDNEESPLADNDRHGRDTPLIRLDDDIIEDDPYTRDSCPSRKLVSPSAIKRWRRAVVLFVR